MMTSCQVVETSVNVTTNSPSQDYTHPDDHTLLTYEMTPRFRPFTVLKRVRLWLLSNMDDNNKDWDTGSTIKSGVLICLLLPN